MTTSLFLKRVSLTQSLLKRFERYKRREPPLERFEDFKKRTPLFSSRSAR